MLNKNSTAEHILDECCNTDHERVTNISVIKELLDTNVIAAPFIFSAIAHYANEYAVQDPSKIVGLPIISPDAWVECAQQIKAKLEAFTNGGENH